MRSNNFAITAKIFLLIALAGCAPATPAGPTPTMVKTPTVVLPLCDGASLVAPVPNAPAQFDVLGSLTLNLLWKYPEACKPDGYVLHLAMGPLYTPELAGPVGYINTWAPGSPLQPGKVYEWWVSAVSGATTGPQSPRRVFFTGPACAAGEMTAPALFEPANGSTINTLTPMEKWDSTGGCIPTGYHLELATDEAFTNVLEVDDFPTPLNRAIWDTPNPFIDCTRYYWHVAQKVSDAIGPYSETWTYRVDINGTCAPEAPPSVSGVVWRDANQDSIRQSGETGIPGVVVNIGVGDCPAFTFTQSATTAADGSYSFLSLLPGKYCMEIDPLADISLGHFTLGASGKEGRAYRAVSLSPGQSLTDQDFGWYEILQAPHIKLKINAYCHSGPSVLFSSPGVGVMGETYPIIGISPDMLWYYVQFNQSLRCWFAGSSGDASGALKTLPLGPTPVPTPVVDCSKYTVSASCIAEPACKWVPAAAHAGYCTNK